MKIFIGGSRAVSKLNEVIRGRLDEFIGRRDAILIGDANGADKAVQQYFAERQYSNVEVFCMEQCRNNIGSWPIRSITPRNNRKDFSYYAAKDIVMAQEAGCGVMFWDGKSKGTFQNVLNLMAAGKRALVYFTRPRSFTSFRLTRTCKRCLAAATEGTSRLRAAL